MDKRDEFDSYEKKLQKLREEIEKGWNGPDSILTIDKIIVSKQVSGNKKN